MFDSIVSTRSCPPATALSACIAATFMLSAPLATAATVTSCDDSAAAAPGTLRYEVANAGSGDTIDFNLPGTCNSTITLETGGLTVTQGSLTIQGPGVGYINLRNDLTGAYNGGTAVMDRVIKHVGYGTLELAHVAVSQGYYVGTGVQSDGGCIYSSGAVTLSHAKVSGCALVVTPGGSPNPTHYGSGAGVFTKGSLNAYYSTISDNLSKAFPEGNKYPQANCGGAYSGGPATVLATTISGNAVITSVGSGGGLCLAAGGLILSSTVSGNTVAPAAGGAYVTSSTRAGGIFAPAAIGQQLVLIDSTISGNKAGTLTGGVFAALPTSLAATTVAFNTAGQGKDSSNAYVAPGLALFGIYTDSLESTLIAYNAYASTLSDFSAYNADKSSGPKTTVKGNNNLILVPRQLGVPPYTITNTCPRLGALADNGGPTKTHALLSFSPALEEGAVINLGFSDLLVDQRGLARTSGLFPDIGAYEMQRDDILFSTNFEQCF